MEAHGEKDAEHSSGGGSGLWDDETFLGRGPAVGAGVAAPIGQHLSVEGELDWGTHRRDSGYLKVDGRAAAATGRVKFAFRDREVAVRPFVSGGASWIRSTDRFTTPQITAGPNGQPLQGAPIRQDFKTSVVGWEFGTGVEITASDRFKIRPEARFALSASDSVFTPGSIEPPLMIMRVGMTLIWTPRKQRKLRRK